MEISSWFFIKKKNSNKLKRLKKAVKLQRDLSYEHPLNYVMMPSTHNSAITYADAYGELQPDYTTLLKKLLPPTKNPLVSILNQIKI